MVKLTSNNDNTVNHHTDWSHSTRNKLSLMKAGSHHAQTKVTSYLDLVDSVNSIISKHPEIEYMHSQALTQQDSSTKFQDLFSPLFKHLITDAERNLQKLPQQIRHDTVI